jgi:hypothetical protein
MYSFETPRSSTTLGTDSADIPCLLNAAGDPPVD